MIEHSLGEFTEQGRMELEEGVDLRGYMLRELENLSSRGAWALKNHSKRKVICTKGDDAP